MNKRFVVVFFLLCTACSEGQNLDLPKLENTIRFGLFVNQVKAQRPDARKHSSGLYIERIVDSELPYNEIHYEFRWGRLISVEFRGNARYKLSSDTFRSSSSRELERLTSFCNGVEGIRHAHPGSGRDYIIAGCNTGIVGISYEYSVDTNHRYFKLVYENTSGFPYHLNWVVEKATQQKGK